MCIVKENGKMRYTDHFTIKFTLIRCPTKSPFSYKGLPERWPDWDYPACQAYKQTPVSSHGQFPFQPLQDWHNLQPSTPSPTDLLEEIECFYADKLKPLCKFGCNEQHLNTETKQALDASREACVYN